MNPTVDVSTLAPEVRTMFASSATPLTAAQGQVYDNCVSQPVCDTGQGTKTIALIDDILSPWSAISRGEAVRQAIQSGQVKKIIYDGTNADVSQYLSAFRQAIAQHVDLIISEFSAYGAQAAPVLAQAKAAGIPVVNGAVVLPTSVSSQLAVQVRAAPCDMWKTGAQTLTDHLKSKGITNPSYAMFSGPAGNSYAASWQPCGEQALDALGWHKVYTGYNIWTPQGQAQAASALLASGTKPDVILADYAPSQFLQAYAQANQKLPVIMVAGSIDVNMLKSYEAAQKANQDPDMWTTSNVNLTHALAVVAGLEVADGKKPSSNPVVYPVNAISFADILKTADLSVNSNSIAGSLLTPSEQDAALKQ